MQVLARDCRCIFREKTYGDFAVSSDDDKIFSDALRKVFWPTFLIGIICFAAIMIMLGCAQAHDPQRIDLNEWFESLKSEDGTLCCSSKEPIVIDNWETRDGHYRVFLKEEWRDVPDQAVVKTPNRAGKPMLWLGYPKKINEPPVIRCFIPGTMT